jgi:hypothetical protein
MSSRRSASKCDASSRKLFERTGTSSRKSLVRGGASQYSLAVSNEFAREEVMDVYVIDDDLHPMGYQEYIRPAYNQEDSENSFDSDLDHTRIFVIIEEGMPRTSDSRQLTKEEAAKRKEVIEHTWEEVRKWLWMHQDSDDRKNAATVWGGNDATPLHNVCKLTNPPANVVQGILGAAPEMVAWGNSQG